MPRRQSSWAGRRVIIKTKEARKTGWVKKTKASRSDSEWGGSWTDDTNESTVDAEEKKDESGAKCIIM
jgi:hypothetical protein